MISLRGFCPGQPIAIWKVENEKLFKPRHLFQSTSCECSYASEAMLAAATLYSVSSGSKGPEVYFSLALGAKALAPQPRF